MASERELKRQPLDIATAREMIAMIVGLCEGDNLAPQVLRLTSRYLDTGDELLGSSGVGLRARGELSKKEARWTVKAGAVPDDRGVAEATEIEIDGLWQEVPVIIAMALRSVGISAELEEIARLTTVRERWLRSYAGVEVEICLDSVTVEYPNQFSFLEIEVEAPQRSELDQLLDLIEDHFPDVPPSPGSKLAMAVSGGAPSKMVGRHLVSGDAMDDIGEQLANFFNAAVPMPAPWATLRPDHAT
jgi:inorganic triphosphatase YgiF